MFRPEHQLLLRGGREEEQAPPGPERQARERARQLEKRMLDRLKKYLEAEMGGAVDIEALTRE